MRFPFVILERSEESKGKRLRSRMTAKTQKDARDATVHLRASFNE
jgi:hypothetical protein